MVQLFLKKRLTKWTPGGGAYIRAILAISWQNVVRISVSEVLYGLILVS